MKRMNTPRTRAEFERKFHLLHRHMQEGTLLFSPQVSGSFDSLARVRFLPNGRIDFLSVDEKARLLANTTDQFSAEALEQMQRQTMAAEQKSDAKSSNKPNR